MSGHTEGIWYTQHGLAVMGPDDCQISNTKSMSRTQAVNEANATRIVACVNACDGYSNDELTGFAISGIAQSKQMQERLLKALEVMLEHEGTVDSTGIGNFPSEALRQARLDAESLIKEIKGK